MLSRKVAAVPPAFVSCLELPRYTIQVLQKDKTKCFRTGSVRQAGLGDAGLKVYDRPFINWHQLSAHFPLWSTERSSYINISHSIYFTSFEVTICRDWGYNTISNFNIVKSFQCFILKMKWIQLKQLRLKVLSSDCTHWVLTLGHSKMPRAWYSPFLPYYLVSPPCLLLILFLH